MWVLQKRLDLEIEIMENIGSHKHIVELYDVFSEEKSLRLVIEYMTGTQPGPSPRPRCSPVVLAGCGPAAPDALSIAN